MKQRVINRVLIVLSVFVAIMLLTLYGSRLLPTLRVPADRLEQWYNSDLNGEAVKLPAFLDRNNQGQMVLTARLPADLKPEQHLLFWTYYSSVEVTVADTLIYRHDNAGTDSFGAAPTSQWNMVALPDDAAGKTILLRMASPYTNIRIRLSEVMVGEQAVLHHWLHNRYLLSNFLESMMVWVSMTFIALAFIQRVKPRYRHYQFFAGLFVLLFSLYLRTGQKAMPIDWLSPFAKELICYLCIYGLSIPFALYTREKVRRHPGKVRWCNLLALAGMATLVLAFILHAFGVADIHSMLLPAYLILLITNVSAVLFAVMYFVKRRDVWSALAVVGPTSILFTLLLEYTQFYLLGTMPFDTGMWCHICTVVVLVVEGVLYFYHLRTEVAKQAQMQEEHRNLQIQMLTDRIRPHFVLNTVGAIRSLIPRDPERAADLLYDFSRYMRDKMEQKDYNKPIPFMEELGHIRTYLKLEKVRFGDTVEVIYNLQETAFYVLPLTIQPFVENAIKHGLFQTEHGGVLTISAHKGYHCYVVDIVDNGVGFDAESLEAMLENKSSIGLRSALLRLENEMHATVSISSDATGKKGTRVHIEIPESR